MFSCLQILEAFLWFVLITLLNVTLIILTLSVSRLLNLLLRLVAFRSEERRVGKECRCRWVLYHVKKTIYTALVRRPVLKRHATSQLCDVGVRKLLLDIRTMTE